jgi:excisionase family DNA binding protein
MLIIQLAKEELQSLIKEGLKSAMAEHPSPFNDDLLSRKEAAYYLKVSLPTLNSWERSGYLQPVRFGSRVYYRKSDLLNRPS